jgi:uncharacterized protein
MAFAETLLLVMLGGAAAGFVQGISGFAFALVVLAIWSWTLDPALIGPLAVFGALLGQILAFHRFRRIIKFRGVAPYVAGGIVGVPIGVALLRHIDPMTFKLCIGLFLVTWCPMMMRPGRLPRINGGSVLAEATVGLVGGVMGGLGGVSGPAPTLWTTLRHFDRDRQRAILVGFNLAMQSLTMITYIATGAIPARAWPLLPPLALAVVIPTLLGVRLYHRISDAVFRQIVLGLLTLSGVVLLATTLPEML